MVILLSGRTKNIFASNFSGFLIFSLHGNRAVREVGAQDFEFITPTPERVSQWFTGKIMKKFLRTRAIIKQGKKDNPIVIGTNSIISSGSFVTKNVSESTTVFGNPAKVLSKSSLK